MIRKSQRRSQKQKGMVTLTFAAMMVGILAFTGLAVDVGYIQFEKRKIQTAADAAAMGALREMELGNTDYTAAGQNDASLNGYTNGTNNTTVTIANPPTSGAYSGQTDAIQATVQRYVPTFFMQILGQKGLYIAATATAQTSTSKGSMGACIFVLEPTGNKAMWMTGTSALQTSCGIAINSSDHDALDMTGTSSLILAPTAQVGVVGGGIGSGTGWDLGSNTVMDNTQTPPVAQTPVNILTFSDPLAKVNPPSASGMNVQTNGNVGSNTTVTLQPGIYCGGMTLQGNATLTSGTYVLAGGGLTINAGANVSNTAGGVEIYNTTGSFSPSCPAAAAGDFQFDGHANINLQGLSVADGVGTVCMLFFEDRSVIGMSHTINGSSTSTFDGAIYFPNANVTFTGTNQSGGYLYMVVWQLTIKGTAGLSNDKSNVANVYTLAPSSTGGGLVQ